MNLTLYVWRQANAQAEGKFERYEVQGLEPELSFLEMLDSINEKLEAEGKEPIAFEHDCREGICGSCGMVINGVPHGPLNNVATCQLHMRSFKDGDEVYVEPWRARAFPLRKDLMVDRSSFERIQQAGGYVSVRTGSAPEANEIPISKEAAKDAFHAAACISCGACVAACKNASAMLFVGARVAQFAKLPQGQPERAQRVVAMVEQMDREGFGNCSNQLECEAACPANISVLRIAELNREYALAQRHFAVTAATADDSD